MLDDEKDLEAVCEMVWEADKPIHVMLIEKSILTGIDIGSTCKLTCLDRVTYVRLIGYNPSGTKIVCKELGLFAVLWFKLMNTIKRWCRC